MWEWWSVGGLLEGPRWRVVDEDGGIVKRVRYFVVEEEGWIGYSVGDGEGFRRGGWDELQLGFSPRRRVV